MDLRRSLMLHAVLQTVLWAVLAVAANDLSSRWFTRIDLTADQRYTLSPAARRIMGRIDKPLVANVFFTGDLQVPYHNHEEAVREKLEELRAYSNGRMRIRYVDPTGDAEAAEEARRFGLQPIPYKYRDREREELRQVYMGVSFVYGDAQETADTLVVLDTLEYDLVKAISALTRPQKERKTVALLQGNGEPDFTRLPQGSPLVGVLERLASGYDLMTVTLGGDEGVPEQVDALLVIGPNQQIPDRAQYQLDQFLMRGGRLGVFVAGSRPDFASLRPIDVHHGLDALLGHYGARLERAVLLDRRYNEKLALPVQVGATQRLIPVSSPVVPTSTNLERTSTIVRRLDRVVLPFTTPITVPDELPRGVAGGPIVLSMPGSTALSGLASLSPEALQARQATERDGPFAAAVALSGRFASFFAQRPIPPPLGREGEPEDGAGKLVDSEPTRLVVVGSADMVANNVPFVVNSVGWLLEDEDLLDIRPVPTTVSEFAPPPADRALRWKAGILGAPLFLLALVGGTVFLVGRRRA